MADYDDYEKQKKRFWTIVLNSNQFETSGFYSIGWPPQPPKGGSRDPVPPLWGVRGADYKSALFILTLV